MGYNIENYRRVKDALERRRSEAGEEAKRRADALHTQSPDLAEIDRALSSTGMQLFGAATAGGEGLTERIAKIRAEHENLRTARAKLLRQLGYAEDYTEPVFACQKCRDTGFIVGQMCDCMRRALVTEGIRSSGLGTLITKQSFDNFSLDYYRGNKGNYERAKHALDRARAYAEDFGPDSGNLMLIGPTGLGKTHLSTAIARTVIERGYDVVYESTQNVLADFEYDRFKSGYADAEPRGGRYLACELLILDDLGTEQVNQFVLSCLYNLLNTRINHGRQTIVSTNADEAELRARYSDRITSRLLGEFEVLMLSGTDIRMQKL